MPALAYAAGGRRARLPQQPDRSVHRVHMASHVLGGLGVDGRTGRWEPDEDPLGEARGDVREGACVRAAHIAVPQGADQRGQGLGEVADIRVQRRPVG